MREIKFKFWNKKRKKMLNGEHDITKGMPMLGDFIWLQYTGMQDVNGTNVYEGDIIYNYDTKYYCEVKFIDGCWKTVYQKDTLQHKESVFLLSHTLGNLYCVEGNIYENAIRIYGALEKTEC